ncbi:MAG TPA: AMP-binding protein, partial [Kofleriaceae bacterium]|nr:AMP-binding protein [Kofleriaceae bacterium]
MSEPDEETAFETLVDVLLEREASQSNDVAYTFCDYAPKVQDANGGPREESTTYGELIRDAKAVAADLQARGLSGHSVILLFTSGLDFLRAYLGCILAGAHATPLRPPVTPGYMQQVAAIAHDAQTKAIMVSGALASRVREACARVPELGAIPVLTVEGRARAATWQRPHVGAGDVALLQYTSGSTGLPKGVVVSHANLLHNEAVIRDAFGQDRSSVAVGWLPMFHDMGLIGNVLQPLFLGARGIAFDPGAFVRRPVRWLQLLTKYRATTSGGPNFGYELCIDRVSEEEKRGLDLSHWTLAFSGAEPVRMRTMRRFHQAFADVGFRMEAFSPCYGLAESTLFVTGIEKRSPPSSMVLDAAALAQHQVR